MSFTLTLSENIDGGAVTLDTPEAVSIPAIGQRAEYTFDASAGQAIVLNTSSVSTTPSGKAIQLKVLDPGGSQIHLGTQDTVNLSYLGGGTYTVIVAPLNGATGTLDLLVGNGVYDDLPMGGPTQSYTTTVPDQIAYFTFDATAGDDLSLAITGLSVNPGSTIYYSINRPSGSYWVSSSTCSESANPGCSRELRNASQTGTYKVRLSPYTSGGTMNVSMTVSENLTLGNLPLDTPTNVSIPVLGQRAELEFSATQAQSGTLTLNSLSMSPSGASVKMQVLDPGGSQVDTATTSSSTTINLSNLDAGVHTIVLSPITGATGTMVIELD